MILQSKFHDYYDAVLKQAGRDPDVVFNRLQPEHPLPLPKDFEFPNWTTWGNRLHRGLNHPDDNYEIGAILFCGKMHPYLKHQGVWKGPVPESEPTYTFDIDAIDELMHKIYADKHPHSKWTRRNATSKWADQWSVWGRVLKPLHAAIERDYTELHREHNTPILAIYPDGWESGLPLFLHINPKLADFGFQRVVDPYQAYQQVYGFLSGVMARPEKEPRPTTDKQKVAAHGFDVVTSFRNDTHPRKGRKQSCV